MGMSQCRQSSRVLETRSLEEVSSFFSSYVRRPSVRLGSCSCSFCCPSRVCDPERVRRRTPYYLIYLSFFAQVVNRRLFIMTSRECNSNHCVPQENKQLQHRSFITVRSLSPDFPNYLSDKYYDSVTISSLCSPSLRRLRVFLSNIQLQRFRIRRCPSSPVTTTALYRHRRRKPHFLFVDSLVPVSPLLGPLVYEVGER